MIRTVCRSLAMLLAIGSLALLPTVSARSPGALAQSPAPQPEMKAPRYVAVRLPAEAMDINNNGVILLVDGTCVVISETGKVVPVLPGLPKVPGKPTALATAINDRGDRLFATPKRVFLLTANGREETLVSDPANTFPVVDGFASGHSLSNRGDALINFRTCRRSGPHYLMTDGIRIFLWSNRLLEDITNWTPPDLSPEGPSLIRINDSNEAGHLVGAMENCGYIWDGKKVTLRRASPGYDAPILRGLNNRDEAVGSCRREGFQFATVWVNGKPIDLNPCVTSTGGYNLILARRINDRGEILVMGQMGRPQPVPGRLAFFVLIPQGPYDSGTAPTDEDTSTTDATAAFKE